MTAASQDSAAPRADVELRLPADGAYASVLRTTAAGLAARLDFTMDEIEDLRIAVAEAGAIVLTEADPDADLVTSFHLAPGHLVVEVATEAIDEPAPDYDSFAWQVLDTIAEDATAGSAEGRFSVCFTMRAQLSQAGATSTEA